MPERNADRVIRALPERCVCEDWRVLDPRDPAMFRRYRGRTGYPANGYVKNVTSPFKEHVDRRLPPLGGC